MSDEKLARNPLELPEDDLYAERPATRQPQAKRSANRDVVLATFSLYPEDVEHLNEVDPARAGRGHGIDSVAPVGAAHGRSPDGCILREVAGSKDPAAGLYLPDDGRRHGPR